MNFYAGLIQLAGSALEILGVCLMANIYFRHRHWKHWLSAFVSALYRGSEAKRAVAAADMVPVENRLVALQGLTFIGLGFLLQAASLVISLLSSSRAGA